MKPVFSLGFVSIRSVHEAFQVYGVRDIDNCIIIKYSTYCIMCILLQINTLLHVGVDPGLFGRGVHFLFLQPSLHNSMWCDVIHKDGFSRLLFFLALSSSWLLMLLDPLTLSYSRSALRFSNEQNFNCFTLMLTDFCYVDSLQLVIGVTYTNVQWIFRYFEC